MLLHARLGPLSFVQHASFLSKAVTHCASARKQKTEWRLVCACLCYSLVISGFGMFGGCGVCSENWELAHGTSMFFPGGCYSVPDRDCNSTERLILYILRGCRTFI